MFAAKDRLPLGVAASCRPATFAAPARINSHLNLRQHSETRPFVFSKLRTLLPAQNIQPPYFQQLAHSLKYAEDITPVFPSASALFVRSFAQVQYSTLLFSIACALFRKNYR